MRKLIPRGPRNAGRLHWNGRSYIDFTSWDIFGFAEDQRFASSLAKALIQHGFVSGASRTSTGTLAEHIQCETRAAQFFGAERALLFSSRNQLILTLLTVLCDSSTFILCDERLEAPVIDAAGLVGAQIYPVEQDNVSQILSEIEKAPIFRPRVLFLEGIQGFTGNVCSYSRIVVAGLQAGFTVCIDETNSFGVFGLRGAGAVDEVTPLPSSVVRLVSLDRHACLFGALLAGPGYLFDQIVSRSRNISVEVSLPPYLAVQIRDALDMIELATERRQMVILSAQRLLNGLAGIGWRVLSSGGSNLVCIGFDSMREADEVSTALEEQQLLVDRHAAFFGGREIFGIRLIVRAVHTEHEIDRAIESLWEVRRRVPRGTLLT